MSIDPLASYMQVIKHYCSDIAISEAYLVESGQNNIVIIVNNAFVFRFARYVSSIDTLKREVMILQHLQPFLTIAIPQPDFVHLDVSNVRASFIRYPLIAGHPLGPDAFEVIDRPDVLDRLACQLAGFLRELHNASPLVDLPIADGLNRWEQMYEKVQNWLFIYMRPDAREQVQRHFTQFLGQNEQLPFTPALRHGDFGLGNIVHNPTTYQVTGVVDFGSAGLGDPATDLAGVLAGCGEPFLQRVLYYYPEAQSMLTRIHFYCGTFALQEALFGLDNNDEEAFTGGMADYV